MALPQARREEGPGERGGVVVIMPWAREWTKRVDTKRRVLRAMVGVGCWFFGW